jgi:ABC-type Na+ efflux pump permease subunit
MVPANGGNLGNLSGESFSDSPTPIFRNEEVRRVLWSFVKSELKRAMQRRQTWLALVVMLAFFIAGFEAYRPGPNRLGPDHYNVYMAFLYAMGKGSSAVLPGVFPLMISLAAGDSLAWDKRTGFDQSLLLRMTFRKYIVGKMLAASLISFCFVYLAALLAMVYGCATFPVVSSVPQIDGVTPDYARGLFLDHPLLYLMFVVFNTALLGMATALLSVLLSTIIRNIYVVTVIPWLMYFVLQFMLYSFHSIRYAPLDMVGQYLLDGVHQYSTWEMPLLRLGLWAVLFGATNLIFAQKFKVRANR